MLQYLRLESRVVLLFAASGLAAGSALGQITPVSYWSLGEESGSVAADAISGLDGAHHWGYALNQDGARSMDGAVRYNVNDRVGVTIVEHSDLLLLDEGTLAFSMFNADSITYEGLISKDARGFGEAGHMSAWTWEKTQGLHIGLADSERYHVVRTGALQANRWYDVVFSWGGGGMHLYMDGALVDTNDFAGGLSSHEPLVFGASTRWSNVGVANPYCDFYSGLLDEIAIYNQALNPTQVQDSLKILRTVPLPAASGLACAGAVTVFGTLRRRRL